MIKVVCETELDASTYPYTFTVVTATFDPGQEGNFQLQAFCTDQNFEWIDDS
jgi:hypothetical protein